MNELDALLRSRLAFRDYHETCFDSGQPLEQLQAQGVKAVVMSPLFMKRLDEFMSTHDMVFKMAGVLDEQMDMARSDLYVDFSCPEYVQWMWVQVDNV